MASVSMMVYPVRESFQGYPQHYAMYQTRPQQPQVELSQPIHVNPYAYAPVVQQQQQQPPPHHHHHHQHQPSRSPQSSGSPVSDDGFKPSLPSISNLLRLSDRPTASDNTLQTTQTPTSQPREPAPTLSPQPSQLSDAATRQQQPTQSTHVLTASPHSMEQPPPPPQMRSDSMIDRTSSPSTISTGSAVSGTSYYVGSTINNVEPSGQRTVQVPSMKRPSVPSQPNVSPYADGRYTASPYATSPGTLSGSSYYSPPHTSYPVPPGLYHQRPLPSNFPPPPPTLPAQLSTNLTTSNPWEHHHYISPSSQATFPQSQDRYICPTCNKAFSRPSSLKIHSHSHTGEKPFRCPHAGCGKAFSVRSNMKRHERGCHSGIAGHHIPHAHMI